MAPDDWNYLYLRQAVHILKKYFPRLLSSGISNKSIFKVSDRRRPFLIFSIAFSVEAGSVLLNIFYV